MKSNTHFSLTVVLVLVFGSVSYAQDLTREPEICENDTFFREDFGSDVDPGDMLEINVQTCDQCEIITGEVINPDVSGWDGGPTQFVTTVPPNFSGRHNGLFDGTMGCEGDEEGVIPWSGVGSLCEDPIEIVVRLWFMNDAGAEEKPFVDEAFSDYPGDTEQERLRNVKKRIIKLIAEKFGNQTCIVIRIRSFRSLEQQVTPEGQPMTKSDMVDAASNIENKAGDNAVDFVFTNSSKIAMGNDSIAFAFNHDPESITGLNDQESELLSGKAFFSQEWSSNSAPGEADGITELAPGHELGHVTSLEHVPSSQDPDNLMNPGTNPNDTNFGSELTDDQISDARESAENLQEKQGFQQ